MFDDDDFYKHTLVDKDEQVQAIICFRPYWRRNYIAFFLVSDEIQLSSVKELKRFVYDAIMDLQADRVQTQSVDCEKLNAWHEFLGFTHEGKHEKFVEDRDYNTWAVVRGRNY